MLPRLVGTLLLLAAPAPPSAQPGVRFSVPGVSIGIRQPVYPKLVLVPGHPVYFDPAADSNYFFYDGLYWVYRGDGWYASEWFDGPWGLVTPEGVPVTLLRVPVSHYRHPPEAFLGWLRDAPPRWGERWGADWERRRPGWNRPDHRGEPAAAPLPTYQRHYTGDRYPRPDQQPALHDDMYFYAPRDAEVMALVQRQGRDRDRTAAGAAARRGAVQHQPDPPRARLELAAPAPGKDRKGDDDQGGRPEVRSGRQPRSPPGGTP